MAGELWDMPNQQVVRAAPPDATATPTATGPAAYDPGDQTVDEVKTYVGDNPDSAAAVTAAEKAGKNRTSLLDWLAGLA